jgi:4-hydroxy 2-oxovalerate aldolase
MKLIDCTLRDGGYYCQWNFSRELIIDYLTAMAAIGVDYVELGFRSLDTAGFRGACAYTTDNFINSLPIPEKLNIAVMVNAAELVKHDAGAVDACKRLFEPAADSRVSLVRIACHVHDVESMLPVCEWLNKAGYKVAINLMQVSERTSDELEDIANVATKLPIEALYFADSLGNLDSESIANIVRSFRQHWQGDLGIHAHDSMGRALINTLTAIDLGVTWVDSTVTGMGRGPGNTKTEQLVIELDTLHSNSSNLTPLMACIRRHFQPMQAHYKWGTNPYYYLAGKYGIHPTYIQEMLVDSRYREAEIVAAIEHLRVDGGKKYSAETLETSRQMLAGDMGGSWAPKSVMDGRDVLVVGAGPGVVEHRDGLERYVREYCPIVIALNTQTNIDAGLIDFRAACHPFRLLADCDSYHNLPQPLVVPVSRLSDVVADSLQSVDKYDFGLTVKPGVFEFHERAAIVPSSFVLAYALAIAASGNASRILLAGFDGYGADDPRTIEIDELLEIYKCTEAAVPLVAITPTRFKIQSTSVYAL